MESFPASRKLPFSKKRLSIRVILSYIVDYVIIVALIIAFYLLDSVEPFHQRFSLDNKSLQYPYAVKERVPVFELCIIAVGGPVAVIAIYTLIIDGFFSHQAAVVTPGRRRPLMGRYRFKDRLWELNCGILGLALAVGAAFTITGTLKNAIGKPRPDLISRCLPNREEAALRDLHDTPIWGLSDSSICRQSDNAILKDGFRSFPSGHSSTAFAGLFYLSIYLAAKMHVLDSKGEVWKTFIVLIPTLGAALIAGSRIMDARHHPFDVITGSLLGVLTAWGSYRQYFPSVSETWKKGRAHPIRSWGKEPLPPNMPPTAVDSFRVVQPPDEEQTGSGYSSGGEEARGNAFRQQVAANQRQRMGPQHGLGPVQPGQYSTGFASPDPTAASNPFISGPRHRHDGYDYSSSEDEVEALELRPQYPPSNVQNQPTYNPISGTVTDTSYRSHAPPQQRTGTPMKAESNTGDLGVPSSGAPAVPAGP